MQLLILKEELEHESRVSITPDICKKLVDLGHEVFVDEDAGKKAGFLNEMYESVGGYVINAKNVEECDVVFSINPLLNKTARRLKNAILIGIQKPHINRDNLRLFEENAITSFALDLIPRTTRAQYMDVLSSQSSLAGYKAVIEASHMLNRALPLMMTTAGTIPAAKVLIIGAGVAGLQAIATARRLGAIVQAFDVRSSAKEQVESLGAKFVDVDFVDESEKQDGVYAKETSEAYKKAQEEKLRSVIPSQDIIITTAQIPFKNAPVIIKSDMVDTMKHGSIIIDLASETGGNCELTQHGKTIEHNGVKIVGFENILSLIPYDASRMYAKNMFAFFELLSRNLEEVGDVELIEDEIIKSTLLTANEKIINPRFQIEEGE